jgi:VanZ family protein
MTAPRLPRTLERTLRVLPAILYLMFTWFASARSADSLPAIGNDKLVHFGEYGLLVVLLVFAFTAFELERITPRALVSAAVLSIAWGVIDEIHQAFVPSRDSSLGDVAADAAGSVAGAALVAGLAWRERRRS